MIIFALLIVLLISGLPGWMMLRLCEGRVPVLTYAERAVLSLILGPTASMLIVTLLAWAGMPLTLLGYALPPLTLAVLLLSTLKWLYFPFLPPQVRLQLSAKPRRLVLVALIILLVWSGIKVATGTVDLVSTPTYWDDAFNNWNMRAKIFYLDEKLTLSIPLTKENTQTAGGVSSYPPTVPLLKAFLATVGGDFSDGLINSIHSIWYLFLICIFFFILRRFTSFIMALFGIYALISLPLVLIHGMNPYADIFLGMHVLAALFCIVSILKADTTARFRSWLMLAALCTGILAFTKNEAMLMYVPLCLAALAYTLWNKRFLLKRREIITFSGSVIGILAIIVLPWLIFKWSNGLTFGNAKAVSGMGFSFNADAFRSIVFQLTREPNFLLLPLLFPLTMLLGWRQLKRPVILVLAVFTVLIFLMQTAVFSFVTVLATEAIMQTGVARGQVQFAPIALMTALMVWDGMFAETA